MHIALDRDAVAMGDDTCDHDQTLDIDPGRTLGSLV
jgi:hypothetical protein